MRQSIPSIATTHEKGRIVNSSGRIPPAQPIILLAGPTGVGKTELAIELAERLQTEIVNADSMQVYRHMDIGTAKPAPQQQARVPHHLLDVVLPDEPFDAGGYLRYAQPVVQELQQRGKIPLVVGGTGLYLRVLSHGICEVAPVDERVRQGLLTELHEHGLKRLYIELEGIDPELAGRLQPQDRQRILRALEVFRVTGRPLSAWQAEHGFRPMLYRTIKVFLDRPREVLYQRINQRVKAMMAQGFLDEVQSLLERGYGAELKSMQALGYRQLAAHIRGEVPLEDAIEAIERDTRRYAKRQLTWFRADPHYVWLPADQPEQLFGHIDQVLTTVSCGAPD
jgi:tRNA dimethylallyltransferase